MARASKKDTLKRKTILKYFKRDSEIYTSFEEISKAKTKKRMLGLFVDQSSFRSTFNKLNHVCCHIEEKLFFKELNELNKNTHDYYCSLLAMAKSNSLSYIDGYYMGSDIFHETIVDGCVNSHITMPIIEEVRLVEIFGKERIKEIGGNGYPHYLHHLTFTLTDDEKKILITHIDKTAMGTSTIITQKTGQYDSNIADYNHNSFSVELDFTQPLKEIQNYIKFLHNEYQEKRVLNIFDFLNIERTPVNQNETYKTNSHKPFNIVLADKLFIYDAKKIGLVWHEIQTELIIYHTKILKISTDKITEDTITDYYKYMIDFIEKKGFLNFKNGFERVQK